MYLVDGNDSVVALDQVPQSSVGAPCPELLATEHGLWLAYLLQEDHATEAGAAEAVGLVKFLRPVAHLFGPPNDEAFAGHPLAPRGLKPYSVSEILNSSWIKSLERMNEVHPAHRPERFRVLRHFIFAFHDSTFECVATDFRFASHRGTVSGVLRELAYK